MPNKPWLSTAAGDRSRSIEPFRGFRTQIDSFFEDWFGRSMGGMLAPRVDVSETDQDVQLTVELPGVEEKDIEVTMAGDQITIKGEKKTESQDSTDEGGRIFHRVERTHGAFQRTLTVPYQIDPDQVVADFKDGILTITLPKPADAVGKAQPRRIEIGRRTV
jgi:HSP20 family protein